MRLHRIALLLALVAACGDDAPADGGSEIDAAVDRPYVSTAHLTVRNAPCADETPTVFPDRLTTQQSTTIVVLFNDGAESAYIAPISIEVRTPRAS